MLLEALLENHDESIDEYFAGIPDVESPVFRSDFRRKKSFRRNKEWRKTFAAMASRLLIFPIRIFIGGGHIIANANRRYDWEGWRKGTNRNLRFKMLGVTCRRFGSGL